MPQRRFSPNREGDRIVLSESFAGIFSLFFRARSGRRRGYVFSAVAAETTPAHIRAMGRPPFKSLRPGEGTCFSLRDRHRGAGSAAQPSVERSPESKLWRNIQAGKFQVSVEIDPPQGHRASTAYMSKWIKSWRQVKVDAIDINSRCHGSRLEWTRSIVAGALEAPRRRGPFRNLTTRGPKYHWSAGPHCWGRGPSAASATFPSPIHPAIRPSVGDLPRNQRWSTKWDSVGLVKVLPPPQSKVPTGSGKTLGGATNFTIRRRRQSGLRTISMKRSFRFHAKIEAGAHFAMTQPLFDPPTNWLDFVKKNSAAKPPISRPDRNLAAQQLQAWRCASTQRSPGNCYFRKSPPQILSKPRGNRSTRAWIRSRPRNACLVAH